MKPLIGRLTLVLLLVFGLASCSTFQPVVNIETDQIDSQGFSRKVDNFIIVMDASSSMKLRYKDHRKLDVGKAAVEGLNQSLPNEPYNAGLRIFGAQAALIYGMSTYSRADLAEAVTGVTRPGGLSRMDRAFKAVAEDLKPFSGQNAVIVVADGGDVDARTLAAAEQMQQALDGRVCIYTIQVGDDPRGTQGLKALAAVSDCGGYETADALMEGDVMRSFVTAAFLGKPLDSDGDGVTDDADQCPETLSFVSVDDTGCPLDSDGDGVADYVDDCPGTGQGIKVDPDGCALDSDGDGVADDLDQCPETFSFVSVDDTGCALDSDGDGVADYVDDCPQTPAGAAVGPNGCPLDSDGDGVADYKDQCPGTMAGIQVDDSGCSLDKDGDGVPNSRDNCPDTAADVEVDYYGCPLPPPTKSAEVSDVGTWIYKDITFASGKSDIRPSSYPVLAEIADVLKVNPGLRVEIQGHTDSRGSIALNMRLSEERAQSVRRYLLGKGVDADQMTAKGYGPGRPIATNDTAEGRARNRRVELKPIH